MGGYLTFLPTKQWQEENTYLMSFGMFKKTEMGVESKGREQISVGICLGVHIKIINNKKAFQ